MTSVNEEWRPIPGFAGYEASNLGRIRSWRPVRRNADLPDKPRIMSASIATTGYRALTLRTDTGGVRMKVHRLVMLAFRGPCPHGMQVRHLDGVRTNNVLSNLAYGTPLENAADAIRHGTQVRGERCSRVKLTTGVASLMRWLHTEHGVGGETLGRWFGVSSDTARSAAHGKRRA